VRHGDSTILNPFSRVWQTPIHQWVR